MKGNLKKLYKKKKVKKFIENNKFELEWRNQKLLTKKEFLWYYLNRSKFDFLK